MKLFRVTSTKFPEIYVFGLAALFVFEGSRAKSPLNYRIWLCAGLFLLAGAFLTPLFAIWLAAVDVLGNLVTDPIAWFDNAVVPTYSVGYKCRAQVERYMSERLDLSDRRSEDIRGALSGKFSADASDDLQICPLSRGKAVPAGSGKNIYNN